MSNEGSSVSERLAARGVSRRDFLKFCALMTGVLAMPKTVHAQITRALETKKRLPVIWMEFQDCAGCSEAFLRASHPTTSELVLDVLSVDYHETIMAAAGKQAEEARAVSMREGGYLLVVEGSIPLNDNGIYCCIGGRSAVDLLREAAAGAAAIVAVGSCASFGGIPHASPNPTGAVAVDNIIKDKPIINLPGCPYNVVNLTATVVHFLTFGELPAVDGRKRPLFAYGSLIHNNCERRGHFDAGEFVRAWGDEGHRNGWCLYQMGCKGPTTYANCPSVRFNEGTSWPVGSGHGCIGCTEPNFWEMPTYEPIQLYMQTPPVSYPEVGQPSADAQSGITAESTAVAGGAVGVAAGAAIAAGYMTLTNRAKGITPEISEEEPTDEAFRKAHEK